MQILIWIVCIFATWHFSTTFFVYTWMLKPSSCNFIRVWLCFVCTVYKLFNKVTLQVSPMRDPICMCCFSICLWALYLYLLGCSFVFVVRRLFVISLGATVYPGYHLGRLKDAFSSQKLQFCLNLVLHL